MTTQERESVMDLVVAAEALLQAFESLMPGVRYIAVQDYSLLNDAPISIRKAVADVRNRLRSQTGVKL